MPSGTIAAGVLAVSDSIWDYPAWQERTKHVVTPFHQGATTGQTGLSTEELAQIKALASRVHSKRGYSVRITEFAKQQDNDKAGREAWQKWYDRKYPTWKVRKDVEQVLREEGRHPCQLLGGCESVSGSDLP